jgi:hypothetical protein
MRDFSWKYFTMTGNVDAYLLYKETDTAQEGEYEEEPQQLEEENPET